MAAVGGQRVSSMTVGDAMPAGAIPLQRAQRAIHPCPVAGMLKGTSTRSKGIELAPAGVVSIVRRTVPASGGNTAHTPLSAVGWITSVGGAGTLVAVSSPAQNTRV
jgi:hypothetical protein